MKNLKNRLLVGLVLSSVIAGTLYADHGMKGFDKQNGCQKGFFKKGFDGDFKRGSNKQMMKMFKELDLSISQRKELRDIMKEKSKNKPEFKSFFVDAEFDKDKFIKTFEKKRENKIKNKAETLEKIYNVLNEKQKKDFLLLVEEKFESKGPRF